MPIIRIRRIVRAVPGNSRVRSPVLYRTGRTDDMMIQIEELLLQESSLAPHFQCILGKDGPLDTLTITAEPAPGESTSTAEAAAHHLADRIKGSIGVTVAVHVLTTGSIKRSTGKMRGVIDQRGW